MKRKILPVLVALFLILVIVGAYASKIYLDKYSYSDDREDMAAYYGVTGEDEYAIIYGTEQIEFYAVERDGTIYLPVDMVHKYLSEVFYLDGNEGLLLYTTPVATLEASEGAREYSDPEGIHATDYEVFYIDGETCYIAADYVGLFTGDVPGVYEYHIHYNVKTDGARLAKVKKDTAVRKLGGVKSPILREIEADEQVTVLEELENWSRVMTSDAIVGYVENKRLTAEGESTTGEDAVGILLYGELCYLWQIVGGKVFGEECHATSQLDTQHPCYLELEEEVGE